MTGFTLQSVTSSTYLFFFQPMGGKGNCSIVPSEVTGIGGVERKPWAYHNKVTVKLTTP
jgi:hypothetical protein